jgi:enoyl-CoA hydratase/carnithine racemase
MIRTEDSDRIRLLRLDRPSALNAFSEALYDVTTEALMVAAGDPGIAVTVITGTGRAFCAGTDVVELGLRLKGEFKNGVHGFAGMVDQLAAFPKPLLMAVNGLALGIGATMLAFADLVFMSSEARVRLPFTDLALAPEAASSVTFPALLGRQNAAWALLSSAWLDAATCREMGLAWKVSSPSSLLDDTMEHARVLAAKPISSLIESKATMNAGRLDVVAAARRREDEAYSRLLGAPANVEALAALAEGREPNFAGVDGESGVRRAGRG